jgi:multiple sugar transport system substrate-binding protein
MQPKSRPARRLFSVLSAALLLAGCRPATPAIEVPTAPYHGIELRIACPGEGTAVLLGSHGRTWAHKQGAKVEVLRYDPAAGPSSAGPADVWVIAPADLPRWAADGRLTPIPESYLRRDHPYAWTDLLPVYREQLAEWEHTSYGLPLVGESPVGCYRSDLLGDASHRAAFRKQYGHDLAMPATWEQFVEIAEYFHEHGFAGRPGPSLPPLPRDDRELDRWFYTIAAGYVRRAIPADEVPGADHLDEVFSFHYDLKTGQPRIATAGFVHTLMVLQRLQACRPAEARDRPLEAFRDGQAVLCIADTPWVKVFQQTPELHDKIGVFRIPGSECYFDFHSGAKHAVAESNRLPYLGGAGWLGVVPRGRENTVAAFDLLTELSGARVSAQIYLGATGVGGPVRSEQLHRERWDSFGLNETQTLKLKEALQETLLHRGLKNPVLCLRTPKQEAHRVILDEQLRTALTKKDADPAAILKSVAQRWEEVVRQQGIEAHRADYRLSLGLLAR